MNYTTKFHLPQWIESDQIRMEDFNAAMAALESSLDSAREAAFRQACNQIQLAGATGCAQQLQGLFYQSMEGEQLPDGVSGMVPQGACCWVSDAAAETTAAVVKANLTVVTDMAIVKDNPSLSKPMAIRFSVQGPATLVRIFLQGDYSGNTNAAAGKVKATLYNETMGVVECVKDASFNWPGTSGSGSYHLNLQMPFRGGCTYRLSVEPVEFGYAANLRFFENGLAVTPLSAASGTASGVVPEGGGLGGLALVRCAVQGAGGTISLAWNGAALSPAATRSIPGPGGITLQETAFRIDGPLPAGSTPVLTLTAAKNGGLALYSWGAAAV